jgi:hypothetical protein
MVARARAHPALAAGCRERGLLGHRAADRPVLVEVPGGREHRAAGLGRACGRRPQPGLVGRVGRDALDGRMRGAYAAVREWALANPHEYALVYGSPVPGYRAPQDTLAPATRVPLLIGAVLRDAAAAGAAPAGQPLPEPLRAGIAAVRDLASPGTPEHVFARGMIAWI